MTVPDYGVTIDAKHSSDNGHFFLSWYTSGFADRTVIDHGNHYLYGSFFNALTAIAERVSPIGRYETGHLLIAVTGLVGIFYVWLTGKLLAGSPGGFLSAAILVLTPTWYGHMFMNPKDVPFAVVFVIALYYFLRAYDRLPKQTRKDV